jgi:hypothetical protein
MLPEIAITPSVFYRDSYEHQGMCDAHMQGIWEPLTERVLVRNLRDRDWFRTLIANRSDMPHQAQNLLKLLKVTNRLIDALSELAAQPASQDEWCLEALESNKRNSLVGILTCKAVKQSFRTEPHVASIENRSSSEWWNRNVVATGPGSPRVRRDTASYIQQLSGILHHASHLMFLDPHLDPSRPDYGGFISILEEISRRSGPAPQIEVHRVCYVGSGSSRKIIERNEWETRFSDAWDTQLKAVGLTVRVVIWSDEHDRHVISNLMGLHLGNGFDTDAAPDAVSTWTRLSSADRDAIQREFDTRVNPGSVRCEFSIGI